MNDAPLPQRSPTPDPRDLVIARLLTALERALHFMDRPADYGATVTFYDLAGKPPIYSAMVRQVEVAILLGRDAFDAALDREPNAGSKARNVIASAPESSLPESNNQSETP